VEDQKKRLKKGEKKEVEPKKPKMLRAMLCLTPLAAESDKRRTKRMGM
jgi:hypothetical protein